MSERSWPLINLPRRQAAILRILRLYRAGLTDEEIRAVHEHEVRLGGWLPQSASSLRTRRAELVRDGWVVDTGQRRKGSYGRNATVWRAVSKQEWQEQA